MSPAARPAGVLFRTLLVTTALALSWLALAQVMVAQEQLTLAGTLENGTANALFAPELVPVILRTFEGPVQLETHTTQPAADGRFEFPGVSPSTERTYFLSADYQGAGYSATRSGEQMTEPVTLTVYEATTDQAALAVTSHTIIITGADPDQRVAEVLERVSLANTTDRTFVANLDAPGMPNLLRFALPPNPHNLDVRSNLVGGDVLEVDLGFAITTPIPPSGATPHQFEFVYRVPYQGSAIDMSRTIRFGAERYQVVAPDQVATLSSPQLADLGAVSIGGRELRLLEGAGFAPGSRLELFVSGLPQPSLLSRLGKGSARWYAGAGVRALIGAGLAGVLGYAVLRRRRPQAAPESRDAQAAREALLQEIVQLDATHQALGLSHERYQARRHDLKERLLSLELGRHMANPALPEDGP